MATPNPLVNNDAFIDSDLEAAIGWMSQRSVEQGNVERRATIHRITTLGNELWDNCTVTEWLTPCDADTKKILSGFI